MAACRRQRKRSRRSACPNAVSKPLERKAVPGADALVTDFEKITLKTTSMFRRAKGGGCDCSRPRLNRPVKITGKTAGNPLPQRLWLIRALVFSGPIRFHCGSPVFHRFFEYAHAIITVLSTHPQGESEGGRDRVASPDAACGHDAAGSRRHLCLAAAGPAGVEEDRADRS